MLNIFIYSIASKKRRDEIDELLQQLIDSKHLPAQDKSLMKYTMEVGAQGNYPSADYYKSYYEETDPLRSIAELRVLVKKALDFFHRESLIRDLFKATNETETAEGLAKKLLNLATEASQSTSSDEDEDMSPKGYSDIMKRPENSGFTLGVKEVDTITNGIQPGCVASVCAFISEGKSTMLYSSVYRNIKQGKKGVFYALEISPDIVWMQLFSRYLYEEHNLDIRSTELIQQTLTEEKRKIVESKEPAFKEMMKGLIIKDESRLTAEMLKNPNLMKMEYGKIMRTLGGLDFVVWDHVNQFELMYENLGNVIVRCLTSAGKTFVNQNGIALVTIFAVQVNREGKRRANKRNGVYDVLAISDLNEVERSSTYLVFMYTTEDMRITQETKITMIKHRLGALLTEPAVVTFNPGVAVVGDLRDKVTYEDDFSDLGESFEQFDDFG